MRVAVPAAAVAIIVAVVLKVSAPATKGAFPVLQPDRSPTHDEPAGLNMAPLEIKVDFGAERALASEAHAASSDEAVAPLDSATLSEESGTNKSGGT